MPGFLDDAADNGLLGGLVGFGGGFMKGMQDAEDRKYKRMEFEAKMKAAQTEADNKVFSQQLEMKKANVRRTPGGFEDAPLSDKDVNETIHKDLVDKGYKTTFDSDSQKFSSSVDPESLKAKVLANRQLGANESANIRKDALDRREHERVLARLNNTPEVKQRLTQYRGLNNALSTIVNADHLTPQQIHEFQQTLRSNMGIRGTGGVEERGETYFKTMGLNMANFGQFLTGDPAVIAKDSNLMHHLKNLAQVEQANISNQYRQSIKAATGGHASMYDRRPDLQEDLDGAIEDWNQMVPQTEMPQPQEPEGGGLINEASSGGLLNAAAGLLGFGKKTKSGGQSYEPDVLNYAREHGITPAEALSVKRSRTGGK